MNETSFDKTFECPQKNCRIISPDMDLPKWYNWLKSSDRNGLMGALSAENRRALILTPGQYTITTLLDLDTSFVDLIGFVNGVPEATAIYCNTTNTNGIKKSARNTVLANLLLIGSASCYSCLNVQDNGSGAGATVSGTTVTGTGIGFSMLPDDEVYLSGGAVAAGWYVVDSVTSDDVIEVTSAPGDSVANVDFVIISQHNRFSHLVFEHQVAVADSQRNGIRFSGSQGGVWRYCKARNAGDYAFRFAGGGDFHGAMYYCEAGDSSFFGDAAGSDCSGTLYSCKAGDYSFGGCAAFGISMSGTFIECESGKNSFSIGKTFSGKAYRCIGGDKCFGAYGSFTYQGIFSGEAYDCYAEGKSFGCGRTAGGMKGKLVRCEVIGMSDSMYCIDGAEIRDSRITVTTTDKDCLILKDGNTKVYNSDLIVFQGGTGKPIDDDGVARDVIAAHLRMNNASNDADGLGANVTNLIGTPYNVIDDAIT